MTYLWFIGALLIVGGSLAMALVRVRRRSEFAIRALRARDRNLEEKISKLEAALADKTSAAEARHLTMMLDGVTSICRRQEERLAELEDRDREARPAGPGD